MRAAYDTICRPGEVTQRALPQRRRLCYDIWTMRGPAMTRSNGTPIVRYEELNRKALRNRRPSPGADLATVYLDKHGKLHHRKTALTGGEAFLDAPRGVYF